MFRNDIMLLMVIVYNNIIIRDMQMDFNINDSFIANKLIKIILNKIDTYQDNTKIKCFQKGLIRKLITCYCFFLFYKKIMSLMLILINENKRKKCIYSSFNALR